MDKELRVTGCESRVIEAKKEVERLTREIEGGVDPASGIRHQGWRALVEVLKGLCQERDEIIQQWKEISAGKDEIIQALKEKVASAESQPAEFPDPKPATKNQPFDNNAAGPYEGKW